MHLHHPTCTNEVWAHAQVSFPSRNQKTQVTCAPCLHPVDIALKCYLSLWLQNFSQKEWCFGNGWGSLQLQSMLAAEGSLSSVVACLRLSFARLTWQPAVSIFFPFLAQWGSRQNPSGNNLDDSVWRLFCLPALKSLSHVFSTLDPLFTAHKGSLGHQHRARVCYLLPCDSHCSACSLTQVSPWPRLLIPFSWHCSRCCC